MITSYTATDLSIYHLGATTEYMASTPEAECWTHNTLKALAGAVYQEISLIRWDMRSLLLELREWFALLQPQVYSKGYQCSCLCCLESSLQHLDFQNLYDQEGRSWGKARQTDHPARC